MAIDKDGAHSDSGSPYVVGVVVVADVQAVPGSDTKPRTRQLEDARVRLVQTDRGRAHHGVHALTDAEPIEEVLEPLVPVRDDGGEYTSCPKPIQAGQHVEPRPPRTSRIA